MILHIMQVIRLGYGLAARYLTLGRNKRLFLQKSSGVLGHTQPPMNGYRLPFWGTSGRCV